MIGTTQQDGEAVTQRFFRKVFLGHCAVLLQPVRRRETCKPLEQSAVNFSPGLPNQLGRWNSRLRLVGIGNEGDIKLRMQPLPNTQQREHRVVSGREMSPQIDQAVFSGAISFRTSWLLRPENILPALSIFPFHPFSATSKFNSSFVMRHSFVFLLQRPESSHFTAFVSALLPRLLLDCAERRIATHVPTATKSAEGAHRGASRIRSSALHIISRNKKLTIRVQNVGQRNCSGLVGPFRKIASARKRGNFTLQLL